MTDKEVLKAVVEYCSGNNVDVKTLNKLSETVSLTAQKVKGRLNEAQTTVLDDAMGSWVEGEPTPREFNGIFRGAK